MLIVHVLRGHVAVKSYLHLGPSHKPLSTRSSRSTDIIWTSFQDWAPKFNSSAWISNSAKQEHASFSWRYPDIHFPLTSEIWKRSVMPSASGNQSQTSAIVAVPSLSLISASLVSIQSLHTHVTACVFECKCLSHLGSFAKSYHRMFYDFAIAVSTFVRT